MNKLVATALLTTYLVMLFGYGMATIGHKFLHAIENPFHTHGHVHQNDHGHGNEQEKKSDDHHHEVKTSHTHAEETEAHSHAPQANTKNHAIDDHSNGLSKLNSQTQEGSLSEALTPLFMLGFSQTIHQVKLNSQVILSESKHHYLSFYQGLHLSPVHQPPSL